MGGEKKKIRFVRVISIPPEETFPGDVLGDARGRRGGLTIKPSPRRGGLGA